MKRATKGLSRRSVLKGAAANLSAGALPLHDPFGHVPGIRELRAFPLTAMAGVARAIGEGDLDQKVTVTSRDEVGQLGAAINAMIEGLKERDFIKGTFKRYVAAGQGLVLREHDVPVRRGVGRHRPGLRIDVPHQAHAGQEVILELAPHLLRGVRLAQDLDGQGGDQVQEGVGRHFPLRVRTHCDAGPGARQDEPGERGRGPDTMTGWPAGGRNPTRRAAVFGGRFRPGR